MAGTAETYQEKRPSYVTEPLLRWRRYADGPLIALAIASLPLLVLEIARAELSPADQLFLDLVNAVVFVAFLVDYLVGLWLCSDRRAYLRGEWLAALIVLAQGLAIVPALSPLGLFRGLRAARAIRYVAIVARLVAIGGFAARDGRSWMRRYAARVALAAAGLTWLTAAVAFTLVEEVGDGQRLGSFFDALWWSTATISTVGYGDIYPVTTGGRIVGGITMIVGVATFAVVTARVASFLVRDTPGHEQEQQPSPTEAAAPASPDTDPIERIERLAELKAAGLVTDEEFGAKRTELLSRI